VEQARAEEKMFEKSMLLPDEQMVARKVGETSTLLLGETGKEKGKREGTADNEDQNKCYQK